MSEMDDTFNDSEAATPDSERFNDDFIKESLTAGKDRHFKRIYDR